MKVKTIVTLVLLAFVAASLGYLALHSADGRGGQAPTDTAAAPVGSTPAVAAANTADDAKAPAHQVLAYYLHNSTRCPSCLKIEKFTTSAIEKNFADELESGALVFQVLNTDEKGNEHFVEDYALVTKSVVLADMHDGAQTRWVNLEEVWDLLGDEKKFAKYIVKNVRDYLNEKK
jgi:hypothetical protein